MGYVCGAGSLKAMANRTTGMNIDDRMAYHDAIFGKSKNIDTTPLTYVRSIIGCNLKHDTVLVRHHNLHNIMSNKIKDVDRFICSLRLFTDTKWYTQLNKSFKHDKPHHHNDNIFERLPFQQFMLLDKLITMLMRSEISEYADLVLMEMKNTIGVPSLSFGQTMSVVKMFTKRVVTHIIPRQHGKTTFSNLLNALCLVFFPGAKLKMVYIAHTKDLIQRAHKGVRAIIYKHCSEFNFVQERLYENNLDAGKNLSVRNDEEADFHYRCSVHITDGTTISCLFHKVWHRKQRSETGLAYLCNELQCVVYSKQNVSAFNPTGFKK